MGEVLQDMMQDKKWKGKLYQSKVKEIWLKAMGVNIAQFTTDIKLRGKKLIIVISSASLRQELAYSKEKLKNRMNEELGEAYIEEVIVR